MNTDDRYIQRYEAIYKEVNDRYDIRGSALNALITYCLDEGGKLSKTHREKFKEFIPDEYFDFIEAATQRQLGFVASMDDYKQIKQ